MMDSMTNVVTAVVISAIVSGGSAIMNQSVQGRLLEDNIKATRELSKTMTTLSIELGVLSERFVTKDEFTSTIYKERVDK